MTHTNRAHCVIVTSIVRHVCLSDPPSVNSMRARGTLPLYPLVLLHSDVCVWTLCPTPNPFVHRVLHGVLVGIVLSIMCPLSCKEIYREWV